MPKVKVSHPDKILFPAIGLTKGELASHYSAVARRMLGHVGGRPVVMERFPDGIDKAGFYQKDLPSYAPSWLERVEVPKKGGTLTQLVVTSTDDIDWMANQNTVTVHTWTSKADCLTRPDRIVMDMDPSTPDSQPAREAAIAVKGVLQEIGLTAYVMASGSRGFHIHTPVKPDERADDLAFDIARLVAAREPDAFTVEHRIADRGDRVFIDYMRNRYAQHAVAPYAVRTRPEATVATPIAWEELPDTDPQAFKVRTFSARLEVDDPWDGLSRHARSLDGPRKKLTKLLGDAGVEVAT